MAIGHIKHSGHAPMGQPSLPDAVANSSRPAARSARQTPISWRALHTQFRGSVSQLKNCKSYFKRRLTLALAAYPEAKIGITERGLALHPSAPPVDKVQALRGRWGMVSTQGHAPSRLTESTSGDA